MPPITDPVESCSAIGATLKGALSPVRWMAAAAALLVAGTAMGQSDGALAPPPGPPASATNDLDRLPRSAYQESHVTEQPYRGLFRDTTDPGTLALRPIGVHPAVHGDSVDASAGIRFPAARMRFPLLKRGFDPQDADLKVGPVYFKLRAVGGAVLWSDNIRQSEFDRESDVIGIGRISGSIVAQLSEGVRIATTGSFVWLPFEGEAGVAGFDLFAPFLLDLQGMPLGRAEITWDTMIGGWNVVFADRFFAGLGRFATSVFEDTAIFEGGGFDEADRAGRYVFRAPRSREERDDRRSDREDVDIVYYVNEVSAMTERLLPGPIRLRVRAAHQNLWYNQERRGLPELRDEITAYAGVERENMRFKPFAFYRGVHTDIRSGWGHEVRVGVNGPITNQLQFHGDVGWFWRDSADHSGRFLWQLRLDHIAGPYTEESLSYGRYVDDFNEQVTEALTYRISQVLGPKMTAGAFASARRIEDTVDDDYSRDELRLGVRVNYFHSPRTTLELSGYYSQLDFESDRIADYEGWTGRVELTYRFTDTFLAHLTYRYHETNSDRRGNSYYENLVVFSMTKYFE